MFWQQREIYRRGVVSNEKSTVVIDLPGSNMLSFLTINVEATNGSTAGDVFLQQGIKKVEVIAEGSREIVSLDGDELFLVSSVLSRHTVPNNLTKTADATQRVTLLVPFGRYPGDPDYYIDCSKFSSLELRITFDYTVGATGIVDESLYLEVIGLMAMEGAPAPQQGYFKTSRKVYFTTVASGEKVIDLPRRNLYRKLGIAVIGDTETVDEGLERYQVDVNNAAKIIEVGRILGLKYKNEVENRYSAYHANVGEILLVNFDVGEEMANCLNSAAFDRVTLTLSQIGAGHDVRVMLQEVVS